MKIALITDTHFGARSDSPIFRKHFKTFYNEIFFPYLEENDIKIIIHLGDIVDRRKYINFVTLKHFRETFINRIISDNYILHYIVGNHDIPYKNTNSINAMKILFDDPLKDETSKNIRIVEQTQTKNFNGYKICMIPWINSENAEETFKHIKESDAQCALGHLEIAGFQMYAGSTALDGINRNIFKKFDLTCSGHYHHKSSQDNIHYLGTPYEITWSDYNDQKGFHILDTETSKLEFIRNPNKIFYKIIYNDKENKYNDKDYSYLEDCFVKVIIQNKSDSILFDKFLESLHSINPADINIVEDNHKLDIKEEIDIDEENIGNTLNAVSDHLNESEIENKEELKKLLNNLYTEAINME